MFKDYITELDTKIVKRKYVGDLTHLALEDNIVLEYEKLNIEREDIFINGHKVNDIYNSSLGFVLVSQLKPHTSDVKIRVDFDKRLAILKSLSSRLLIESVLNKYFNLKATNYYSSSKLSSFHISGIYFDQDARKISEILEKNIAEYIKYDVKIIGDKSKNTTKIPSLITTNYLDHSLTSIVEIKSFKIDSFRFDNNGVEIFYYVN